MPELTVQLTAIIARLEAHERDNSERMNARDLTLLERATHIAYFARDIVEEFYSNNEDNLANHYSELLVDGLSSVLGDGTEVSVLELDKFHKLMWSLVNDFHDHVSYIPESSFSLKSVLRLIGFGPKE